MSNFNQKPLNQQPLLNQSFPNISNDVKIHDDRNNPAHGGPHFDAMQSIPGGVDKVRITPNGTVQGGTTHIGKAKLDW